MFLYDGRWWHICQTMAWTVWKPWERMEKCTPKLGDLNDVWCCKRIWMKARNQKLVVRIDVGWYVFVWWMMMTQLLDNRMNWAVAIGAYVESGAKMRRFRWWLMLWNNLDDSWVLILDYILFSMMGDDDTVVGLWHELCGSRGSIWRIVCQD